MEVLKGFKGLNSMLKVLQTRFSRTVWEYPCVMIMVVCAACSEDNRALSADTADGAISIDGDHIPDVSTVGMDDPNAAVTVDANAPEVDQNLMDAEIIDAAMDMAPPTPVIPCNLSVNFTAPANLSFHQLDSPPTLSGTVLNDAQDGIANLTLDLTDENARVFATVQTDETGNFSVSAAPLFTSSGFKLVRAFGRNENGVCEEYGQTSMYVCGGLVAEDFDTLPESWTLYRSASWDPGGWLELTGNGMGQAGAAYNTVELISSGLASIEVTLTTGGGQNDGGDGFAFTIVETNSSEDLLNLLNAASTGGGLGYGVGGAYAISDYTLRGDALTVEVDTWHNVFNGASQRHTDPTSESHVAITRNADPGDHVAWFPVPNIEDLQPRNIRVDLFDGLMRITFDGEVVIEQEIEFSFKGGYMFFSGSTGWATNYHRVDNLRILHNCR